MRNQLRQRQKGHASGPLSLQKFNRMLGGICISGYDVLHAAAQSDLYRCDILLRHIKKLCNRTAYTISPSLTAPEDCLGSPPKAIVGLLHVLQDMQLIFQHTLLLLKLTLPLLRFLKLRCKAPALLFSCRALIHELLSLAGDLLQLFSRGRGLLLQALKKTAAFLLLFLAGSLCLFMPLQITFQ